MILLIDNYDSFVFNLARYFQRLGQTTQVVRNDAICVRDINARDPQAIVLSPGPCGPAETGNSLAIVREFWQQRPFLGVCLGHQSLAAAFGAQIRRAPEPWHGRTSHVFHDGQGIFCGVANPLIACRYHSLVVDESTLPTSFEISARTADGIVMSIRHRERPVVGVQFHPESILTEGGFVLLNNFLRLAGVDQSAIRPSMDDELLRPPSNSTHVPDKPVTF